MTITKEMLDQFKDIGASTVYEAAGKLGDLSPGIRPIGPADRMVGPAYTIKCWPGDISPVRRAVDEAPVGSVLVIDAGETVRSTCWGGGAVIVAKRRGLAGTVCNGATRDLSQISKSNFPVFCTGVTVRGAVRSHPGWIGIPVCVGGVVIHPGDLIVADADGVVAVEVAKVQEVLAKSIEKKKADVERGARMEAGERYNI